jgi:ABC-type transport system involved in Fe-S cluster assembly fused permease/ATPase subunit
VQHADEIIVLHEGQIVERGRHEQLLQNGGYYASTAREQTLAESDGSSL